MITKRFSLRDALWVTAIAALLVAWLVDTHTLSERCRRAELSLFHAQCDAAVAKSKLEALAFSTAQNDRQRRAAMGLPE